MFVRKKKPFFKPKRPYKQDFKNKATFDKSSNRKEVRTCFNCNKKVTSPKIVGPKDKKGGKFHDINIVPQHTIVLTSLIFSAIARQKI